jgi:hypothetical protein
VSAFDGANRRDSRRQRGNAKSTLLIIWLLKSHIPTDLSGTRHAASSRASNAGANSAKCRTCIPRFGALDAHCGDYYYVINDSLTLTEWAKTWLNL